MFMFMKNVGKVSTDKNYQVNGEMVRANLRLSTQRKPMGRAQAMFYKALLKGNCPVWGRFKFHLLQKLPQLAVETWQPNTWLKARKAGK